MKNIRSIIEQIGVARIAVVLSPLVAVLLFFGAIKIYFIRAYPEHVLKERVMEFIKENFGKAATFDDVYMSAFGNIIIFNLNVSIAGDFNDNISLIKCPSAEIRTRFFKLFSGEIIIQNIIIDDSELTIYKKYGRGYYETFNEIFRLDRPLSEISSIDHDAFRVDISSSRLEYREVFRNEILAVKLDRFSMQLFLRGNVLDYVVSGQVLPHQNSELSRGRIKFSGSMRHGKEHVCDASINSIVMTGLDMRYIQPYLNEALKDPLRVEGRFDADVLISSFGQNISAQCRIEVTNLTAEKLLEGSKHACISNENLNMDFIIDVVEGGGRVMVKRATLYDDSINVSLEGIYRKNDREHSIDAIFHSNKINLERMSEHITPWKDTVFKGILSAEGKLRIDFNSGSAKGSEFEAKLKDFGIVFRESKDSREFLKGLDAEASLKDGVFIASMKCSLERSKIEAKWNTKVKSWAPFSSESHIEIASPELEIHHIAHPLLAAIHLAYDGAYSDRKLGYENIIFRDEPVGKLLNQNNLQFRLEAKKLLAGHRAQFGELAIGASLRDGIFAVDTFSLSGYGAEYSLKTNAQFNLWMPMVSIDASVKNFDLKSFAADAGIKGEVGGVLSASASFQVGAFRLSQILENAIVDVNIDISGGVLKNTPLQDRFSDYLNRCNIKSAPLSDISNLAASLSFNQRADNYIVSKLAVMSDKIRFYARGKYDYFEGLDVPVEITAASEEGQGGAVNIPCRITGPLLRPLLSKIKNPKDKETVLPDPLVLFNVQ